MDCTYRKIAWVLQSKENETISLSHAYGLRIQKIVWVLQSKQNESLSLSLSTALNPCEVIFDRLKSSTFNMQESIQKNRPSVRVSVII